MKLFAVLVLACAGCDRVFGLERESDASVDVAPCSPGEQAVMPGAWQSGAALDDALIVGYQRPDDHLVIQVVERSGQLPTLPFLLSSFGENLRIFAGPTAATPSFNGVPDGWDQVFTTSMTAQGLDAQPKARTPNGNHSTQAVSVPRNGEFLLAFRREVPNTIFEVAVLTFGSDWSKRSDNILPLSLGTPVAARTTPTGYLLQLTGAVVAVEATGDLGSRFSTAGYEEVSFVDSTPPDQFTLVRTSGGGIEVISLDASAQLIGAPELVATGRSTISNLRARNTPTGTLLVWQETDRVYVARAIAGSIPTASEVMLMGSEIVPVAIVEGEGGPLLVVERDAPNGGDRELATVQVCEPRG